MKNTGVHILGRAISNLTAAAYCRLTNVLADHFLEKREQDVLKTLSQGFGAV